MMAKLPGQECIDRILDPSTFLRPGQIEITCNLVADTAPVGQKLVIGNKAAG